ncbi:GNAT family protein [Arthrobacter sp. zg-Y1219]|uniref:GNAT family N-acetyltransferase n=1 Tax=Arthrobacter sp. zg-Y1219 TaxID=3049067 RepID=UPI0024C20FD2|nr:GNAT family protein [Arthrobacter sp. zg-Y1219]MDK1360842.1 GNAT family protein [Arthrobacter sp. zg-Y1219]
MISENLFAHQATLTTERLRLEPLGPEHFDGAWAALQDPEAMRLTGTHAEFTPDQIRSWLAGLAGRHDRADWAVIRRPTGQDQDQKEQYLGEVVLNDLDPDNASVGFRIVLSPADVLGQGYGTEATRAVVRHAFDDLGLHRVALEVFAFNPRAQRAYEKAGFTVEGRQRNALRWDGAWVDAVSMGMLAIDPRV